MKTNSSKTKQQKLEERFIKAWGRKPKGKILTGKPKSKKKKVSKEKFELTDKIKEYYEELNKLHHIENPSIGECPYF